MRPYNVLLCIYTFQGTVPKLVVPNMNVGERPKIPLDYDSIAKHCPCDHNIKPSNVWNNEVKLAIMHTFRIPVCINFEII